MQRNVFITTHPTKNPSVCLLCKLPPTRIHGKSYKKKTKQIESYRSFVPQFQPAKFLALTAGKRKEERIQWSQF